MKLQHLSVIFIIITIPIILLLSYYLSLQMDTIKQKNYYDSIQKEATKEAVEAFEINTVEWNEAYSRTADSKRRDIMASINTFTTAFANNLGMSGTSKETILPYIPAIAFTLYDGYYIYSPAEIKEVVKDKNGVVVYNEEGNILYEAEKNPQGEYEVTEGKKIKYTVNEEEAKSTYAHILKPFSTYSARYSTTSGGGIDIVVNYTLDNYITVTGVINNDYVIKSGYLIDTTIEPNPETLTEKIAWKWSEEAEYNCDVYNYVYAEDNAKVYFDGNTAFTVNSIGIRTNLSDRPSVKYKKLIQDGSMYYQALNSNGTIEQGKWYDSSEIEVDTITIEINKDVSAINYYQEAIEFNNWVKDKLLDKIKIGNIQITYQNDDELSPEENQKREQELKDSYGNADDKIFDFSTFNEHKRAVIKQTLISDLNQAITSYSRNSKGEYQLPILSETDWDQILRNVSIITFVQDIPIGMKYYNNYAIATSTSNKEYVNVDEIYLSTKTHSDGYYHMPNCDELKSENVIGYRNIDYVIKSYEEGEQTKYYYKHENLAEQACYYCIVQRSLYEEVSNNAHKSAYDTALARERYVTHEFRNQEWNL